MAKSAAQAVLTANCNQCHGSTLALATAGGRINFIGDIDALVEAGKIIPLNGAASPIVQLMLNGSMPPKSSGLPAVSSKDIELVSAFVDNPRFWSSPMISRECSGPDSVLDFDEVFQGINRDLSRADADDRAFYRYISLSNHAELGCDGVLEQQRIGLIKMLNMLSIKATVEQPTDIDGGQLLYRIDLRDFDWNRAVTVDGRDFADVWEAIAAANPYAVEFVGDDADDAKADTGTTSADVL